jgi:hypothetical protein
MFLTATLSLNPSAPTEDVASDNEVGKSKLMEHETFSMSSILQQFVLTMRDVGITDSTVAATSQKPGVRYQVRLSFRFYDGDDS